MRVTVRVNGGDDKTFRWDPGWHLNNQRQKRSFNKKKRAWGGVNDV